MENTFIKAEALASSIKDYINTRVDGIKLSAAEKLSGLIANVAAAAIALFVFLLAVIFGGISLAFVLGYWIGEIWLGFLSVAFAYLVFGIIIWKLRKSIIQLPLMNALIEQLFKIEHEEN